MNGKIKKKIAEKGFGFIAPANGGSDLFFHFSNCVGKVEAYDQLQEGDAVTFEVQEGQKGPMAVQVQASFEMTAANDNQFGDQLAA